MRCEELQAVLEQEGLGPLPLEAREHLAECADCQDFFAELSAIVGAARQFPAEVSPPDRVWISLRAQLAAEGVIREEIPAELSADAPWWQGVSHFFRPRMLASVGVGVLVVLASMYVARRLGPGSVSRAPAPAQPQVIDAAKTLAPAPVETSPAAPVKRAPLAVRSTRVSVPAQPRESSRELRSSPSENAYLGEMAGVLDQTESALPGGELTSNANAMADAALRTNLRTLNEFIAECEARLKLNPQDQLTREYLNVAYQQKAELLTAMMDSGRSEH